MHAIWNGSAVAPPNTIAFAYPNNVLYWPWQGQENNGPFGDSCVALSDAITITKLTFYVTTAPGTGASYTLTARKNATTDTSASVTISGNATSASWTGSASFSQLDLLSISCTPSGGPASSGNVWWTIEYDSVGSDYYLLFGACGSNQQFDFYGSPFSMSPYSGTATDNEVVIPTDLTVTKIAANSYTAPNSGTYIFAVRKNNTTDSSFTAVMASASTTALSSAGSLAFTAGDRMVVKRTSTGSTAWTTGAYSLTVVPSFVGEVVQGFGNNTTPSSSTVQYEGPKGVGNELWDNTEANVYMRVAACTIKKLYVSLAAASGSGTSYAFTLRSNTADTSLVATLANTTTGNDTTHTATHADGNFFSVKMTPTSTPAATAGVKIGFVQLVTQPAVTTGVTALLGTTAAFSSTQTVGMTFSGYSPQNGDIIYFYINNSVGATAITTPAGWVNVLGGNTISAAGAACSSIAIYHVVTTSEVAAGTTTYTATNLFNSGATGRAGGCVLRGADTIVFVDDSNTTFSSSGTTTHVLSGLTGANLSTGSLILGGVGGSNLATYTVPSGWSQIILNSGGTTAMGLLSNNTPTTASFSVASTNITCSVSMAYSNITVAVLPRTAGIMYVSSAQANTNTVAMPSHSTNDLLIIVTYVTSATPPSLPAGWTNLATAVNGSAVASRVGYKIATSSSETSGTWTNAQSIFAHVYRYAIGPGSVSSNTGNSNSIDFPALNLLSAVGSWVERAAGHNSAGNVSSGTIPGYTNRLAGNSNLTTKDTNGPIASSPTLDSQSVNTTNTWVAWSWEILYTSPQTQQTQFFDMF
jgi:hypothetical protein